ncbi:MAG TPA: hypothetical protein VN578_06665 [Candidatus Binatia bacterium]|jgi:hypothetical protein|nr:hypothetical protein [Candidatus Binatia bacterium]
MKREISFLGVVGAVSFWAVSGGFAADSSTPAAGAGASASVTVQAAPAGPSSAAPAASASVTTAIKLPYGVDDVVKLSRAQISEEIILNYVRNSGTVYNLGPNDLVYLRNQGVSDHVVNAMLDQRPQMAQTALQTAPQAAPAYTAPATPDANTVATEVPTAQPASSVYAYAPAQYPYYGYYQPYGYYYPPYPYYYGGYYGGPVVSFGFGFGGGYRYGGYRYGGHWYGGRGYGGHGHFGHR